VMYGYCNRSVVHVLIVVLLANASTPEAVVLYAGLNGQVEADESHAENALLEHEVSLLYFYQESLSLWSPEA